MEKWQAELRLKFRGVPWKIRVGFSYEWKAWLIAYDIAAATPEEFAKLPLETQKNLLAYGAAAWHLMKRRKKVFFAPDDIATALRSKPGRRPPPSNTELCQISGLAPGGAGRKKKRPDLTLADIYDMAFAELGLNEKEFWSLPPFKTYLMQMHYNRRVDRAWEQTRFLAMMINNTQPSRKRDLSPQQIVRLPFDEKKKEYPQWTQETAEDLIKKWPDIKKN